MGASRIAMLPRQTQDERRAALLRTRRQTQGEWMGMEYFAEV